MISCVSHVKRAQRTFLPLPRVWLVAVVSIAVVVAAFPTVRVKQGLIMGQSKKLPDGSMYFSFKGIPYAQPPVGNLRFKAPLPPKPWKGIYKSLDRVPSCLPDEDPSKGSEDCLFLNVYTTSLSPRSKLPVMVFVHGGGYQEMFPKLGSSSSSSDIFGPEFLLPHDVLLVTINYRLGALGFLCLDIPEVPGNAGMRDQVAALRWIQENIARFGGDPDNVTLFGQSAGSSSLTQHMISPMSKGLFHKGIGQGTSCLQDWTLDRDGRARAFRLGKSLGKETNNPRELLEFLQNISATTLRTAQVEAKTEDEELRSAVVPFNFVPVIEKQFANVNAFLSEEPVESVLSGVVNEVPLMIGYNSAEGFVLLPDLLQKEDVHNKNSSYLIPRDVVRRLNVQKRDEFGNRIRKFYFGNKKISNETAKNGADLLGDAAFGYNVHRFAYLYYSSNNKPIYLYKFSCDTQLNYLEPCAPQKINMPGACHADELWYQFSSQQKNFYEKQKRLKTIIFQVSKLWSNFAKTSNPTPDSSLGVLWPRFTRSGKEYLDIGLRLRPGRDMDSDRVAFLDAIHCEAGLPCINDVTNPSNGSGT